LTLAPEAFTSISLSRRADALRDASVYKWKAKFGGMELSEAKLLRALEDENARLKAVAGGRDARQHRSVFDGMDHLLTRPGRKVPILCEILTDLERTHQLDGAVSSSGLKGIAAPTPQISSRSRR
jgi:hypothetical protein